MVSEFEKVDKAKTVLLKIGKGINPLSGDPINDESFLNDPRIIRCFYFMTEVLDNVSNGTYGRNGKLMQFVISPEQKGMVVLPEGLIGVTEFSKHINLCIDQSISKKLTGVEINKRLRKIGVLGEETNTATGKSRTVSNPNSKEYGFEMITRTFNGSEYDMVVMNDTGKRYLMEHLEEIMSIEA
jgi:hypothetical protein